MAKVVRERRGFLAARLTLPYKADLLLILWRSLLDSAAAHASLEGWRRGGMDEDSTYTSR